MWQIKRNTEVIASVDKLEYHGEWLGESYVTADVTSPTPIDFKVGDYIEYRGERYEINYDPAVVKSAPIVVMGNSFKYENIKFNSLSDELTRCDFLDIVLHDNNIHYTALPTFRFFAQSVHDLADRIQANLDRTYPNQWAVEVAPEYEAVETDKDVQVDKVKCWDALALCESLFKTYFTVRGRHILIGAAGVPTEHLFKYGKNNGLYEIERTADTDQAIVTRLRAYGSTRNMPHRYYNSHFGCYASFEITQYGTNKIVLADPRGIIPNRSFYGTLNGYKFGVRLNEQTSTLQVEVIDLTQWGDKSPENKVAFDNWWSSLTTDARFNTTEGVDFYNLPEVNKVYTDTAMPNNMAVKHLMLPGFPGLTLDPYIESENVKSIGIREGSIFFDGSNEELGEIYPSIEDMTAEQLIEAGVKCNSEGALDVLVGAEQIQDDGTGIVKDNNVYPQHEKSTFYVEVKDLGFDINDYLTTESAKISFKSGKLTGREFEITKCEAQDDGQGRVIGYRLELLRVYDEDVQLFFPYNDYNAQAEDKFVLLAIEMPVVYIQAASQRLLKEATQWLAKNDYARSTYAPKIDEIFMARQHTEAIASKGAVASLHDTIKEGMQLLFEDADLGIDAAITIATLTIKESDKSIPIYEVTLKDEKTVSTLQRVQNKVDSIAKGLSQGGSGHTAEQIRQMIGAYGKDSFLSKRQKDTAKEEITFQKGLSAGVFNRGLIGGSGVGIYKDANGNWVIESDRLNLRQDLQVNNLVVNQAEARGGMMIDTAAYLEISNVVESADGYTCYFNTHSGTIANLFKVDDVAYCQRWTPENATLKYYKRRVLTIGTDSVTLSKSEVDGTGIPAGGDVIIHYGNYTDKERQYVKVRDVVGGGYERYIEGLDSVNAQGDEFFFVGKHTGENARWFVGDKNGANIEFKDSELALNQVKLSVTSRVGNQSIDEYVSDKVGNVQVGGANMILHSDVEQKDYVVYYHTSEPIKSGNTYTLTLWTSHPYQRLNIGIGESASQQFSTTQATMDGKCRCTFTVGQDYEGNEINTKTISIWHNSPVMVTIQKAKLEIGQISTDWTPNQEEILKPVAYLERALKESTTIDGGLIATSLIQLGYTIDDNFVVQSGINGLSDPTRKGNGVAFWAGGDMVDAEETEDGTPAKFLIRHDGTGYMTEMKLGKNLRLAEDELIMVTGENGKSFTIKAGATGYKNLESAETPEQTYPIIQTVQAEQWLLQPSAGSTIWATAMFNSVTQKVEDVLKGGSIRVNLALEWSYPIVGTNPNIPDAWGYVTVELLHNGVVVDTFVNSATGQARFNWANASSATINGTRYAKYACNAVSESIVFNEAGDYELRFTSHADSAVEPIRVDDINLTQNITTSVSESGVYQTIIGTDGFASHWGESLVAVSEQGAILRFGDKYLKVSAEGIAYNNGNGEQKLI